MSAKDISPPITRNGNNNGDSLVSEKMPTKKLQQLLRPENVVESCSDLIEELFRADILRSHGLEPRNKLLLIGPAGNGKTSLA